MNDPQWTLHKKHVFAFSEAGKPIYSRWKFFFITGIIINFHISISFQRFVRQIKVKVMHIKKLLIDNKAWESAQENASTLHGLNRTHYSYLLHCPGITRHCSMLYAYWSNGRRYKPNPYHNQPLLKVQLPGCAWTLFINVISIFHSFRYSESIKAMFMFYKVQLISLHEHSKGFLATAHLQAAWNTVELTHLKLWIWSISQLWLQFNFSSTSVEDLFLCTFNI